MEHSNNTQNFIDLIKNRRRGKLKLYIGMIAGVGKTYRMLNEAHNLLRNGVDVKVGFVETHDRAETSALLEGLPIIPRRKLFYKGKELEEMDLSAILLIHPEVVIVDELAHSNIEGSRNKKRWQDVIELLENGIYVISAINIQHFESLNEEVKKITGVDVKERVPDSILKEADEVVNIDLPADELITRLKEGKIYKSAKIQTALNNFFKNEQILQLRELALKEVASAVERQVENEVVGKDNQHKESFLACINSSEFTSKNVIRKTARLAKYYQSKWYAIYVETPRESFDKIALDKQRHLINSFQLVTELGGEIIKAKSDSIADAILQYSHALNVTSICIGKPHFMFLNIIHPFSILHKLLKKVNGKKDIIILN